MCVYVQIIVCVSVCVHAHRQACVCFSLHICACVCLSMYVFVCLTERVQNTYRLWEDIKEGKALWPTPHCSRMTPTPRKCHMPTRRRVLSVKLSCIETSKQEMVYIAAQFGCLDPS